MQNIILFYFKKFFFFFFFFFFYESKLYKTKHTKYNLSSKNWNKSSQIEKQHSKTTQLLQTSAEKH